MFNSYYSWILQNGGMAPAAFNNFNLIGGLAGGGVVNGGGANPNVAQQPAENLGAGGPAIEGEDVGIEDVDNANNAAAQGKLQRI